jgi:hypothetical protein
VIDSRPRYDGRSVTVYEVFTPTSPARLNFVPRNKVNDNLVDALRTPGKQIIVYGETGSGKSTLLQNKLDQLYSSHIVTRCTAMTSFESLLMDAFDQLGRFYLDSVATKKGRTAKAAIGADFLKFKATIDAQLSTEMSTQSRRMLPPQLTAQRLAEFLGAADMCWVLEDFHKVPLEHKTALAQTFKVFSDTGGQFPAVKIIAIGATETAREVVEYDREMANRVAEILVQLMSEKELLQILQNGSALLNVDFSKVAEDVVAYSAGLASVCHHIAQNLCLTHHIQTTVTGRTVRFDGNALADATKRYVAESSDTLKATFDRALRRHKVKRYDNCKLILAALAAGPITGMLHSELLTAIRREEANSPAGNLTNYLGQLVGTERGSVIRRGLDGKYRFSEPLYHTFAQVYLGVTQTSRPDLSLWLEAVNAIIDTDASWIRVLKYAERSADVHQRALFDVHKPVRDPNADQAALFEVPNHISGDSD